MSRTFKSHHVAAVLLVPVAVTAFAAPARAQAYLPARGEGSVSVLFNDTDVLNHYFTASADDGSLINVRADRGRIRSESLLVDVTYGLTDKIAVSIGIPWVASKYTGPFPHVLASDLTTPNPVDDGSYYSTFQDFRFDLRYNVTKKGMVLTPFIGSIVPSHDYQYFAHAGAGRDLKEMQLGVLGAKLLDSLVPGLFVQGRYSYGFPQTVVDVSHNRSNMDLEVGYFVTPKLRLLALGSGQITHGGLDYTLVFSDAAPAGRAAIISEAGLTDFSTQIRVHHDQIERVNFLHLGGGVTYALTENMDLFGSMITSVAQRNGHEIHRGVSVGASWSFSTNRGRNRAIASNAGSLAKCLCEKRAM